MALNWSFEQGNPKGPPQADTPPLALVFLIVTLAPRSHSSPNEQARLALHSMQSLSRTILPLWK